MSRHAGDSPHDAFQAPQHDPPHAPPPSFLSPPYYYHRPDPNLRPRLFLSDAPPASSPAPGAGAAASSSYHYNGAQQHSYAQEPSSSASSSWAGDLGAGMRAPIQQQAWSAGPSSADVFYAAQELPSGPPMRRSTSLTSSSASTSVNNNPHSPEISSRDELQAQLASQAQHDKKRRVEREKDARLEFLERKCYQLESELKRVGGPPSNYAPVNDATEALVASLRRENYELRQALKAEGEASEDNDASPTSDSASPVPSHGQTSPPLLPTHPLHRAPTSFSAATRQRIALAPQLLLRTPSSEEGDGEMDTGEQTQPYTFPGHAPPTPNSGGHLGGGTA